MANGNVAQRSPQELNALARGLILQQAIKKTQEIHSVSFDPAQQNVFNIAPRNAGLILGFWVEVSATVTEQDTGTLAPTPWGPSNLLSRIQFTDLNNNVRINTTGWHINSLNSAKNRSPFLAPQTLTGYPIDYGANFGNLIAAPSIAQEGTETVKMMYWVPLAYSSLDLRGSVYAGVVNATMNLQLVFNRDGFRAATGANAVNAVYQGAGTIAFDEAEIKVYQVYYDQLPVSNAGPVLPMIDLATIYELKDTVLTGLSVSADFPIPYANFRDFLSTTLIYDNGTQLNDGTDINYLALQAANYVNIFKVAPNVVKAWERQNIRDDFPSGTYYIDTRDKPVSTVMFGNMELIVNPSVVNANARCLVGWESFALLNQITTAASLSAG